LFTGPHRRGELRARLQQSAQKHESGWLWRMLERIDATTAERIHANDTAKLIRAIEVCVAARRPMSQIFREKHLARDPLTGFRLLRIGLNPPRTALPPREGLYDRINERCAAMFAAGLVEETRGLIARYGPVKALDSLGYKQARSVLDGSLSLEAAIAAAQQGHRNYAKRQMTWFRREPEVQWIAGFGDDAETLRAARRMIEAAW
jgi:tRNA dimethylallyltransferase